MTETASLEAACNAPLPLLLTGSAQLGVQLAPEQLRKFVSYCRLLVEGNQRANLTGVREPESIMTRLFLDSLTLIAALPAPVQSESINVQAIDVGAGAGLPGIPLAIVRPNWTMVLVESIGKKARFLEETAAALELPGVKVQQARAEEIGLDKAWRDSADICTARAVASLDVLLEYCAPLVRVGGWLMFPKSGNVEAEVSAAAAAARVLRVDLDRMVPVPANLGLGQQRYTVVYRKVAPTPPGYPRRVGLARTRPIGGK